MFACSMAHPAVSADPSGGKDVTFGPEAATLRFFSVTHDILGDPFWAVYRRGLADAAARLECWVHHLAPARFSPEEMAAHLETAVAARPHGILSTVPDAEAVEGPLRAAADQGIPVIAVNAADARPAAQRIPYLLYLGADDVTGGRAAAERLLAGGVPRRGLCVDHYLVEHACHTARAAGFAARMAEAGVEVETVRIPGDDHGASVERLAAHLRERPDVDAVCTLGPPGCGAAIAALDRERRLDGTRHASFDLAPEQLAAVRAGQLTFTVDSQQYLQGYLGVTLLRLHAVHGLLPAGDVLTGPAIVDAGNVDAVADGVAAGVR